MSKAWPQFTPGPRWVDHGEIADCPCCGLRLHHIEDVEVSEDTNDLIACDCALPGEPRKGISVWVGRRSDRVRGSLDPVLLSRAVRTIADVYSNLTYCHQMDAE